MGSHFGVEEFTQFRTYFCGDWDVHWGCGVLTHGHMGDQGPENHGMTTKRTFAKWEKLCSWSFCLGGNGHRIRGGGTWMALVLVSSFSRCSGKGAKKLQTRSSQNVAPGWPCPQGCFKPFPEVYSLDQRGSRGLGRAQSSILETRTGVFLKPAPLVLLVTSFQGSYPCVLLFGFFFLGLPVLNL